MTRLKLTRMYVQRVLMGPEELFTPEMLADELTSDACTGSELALSSVLHMRAHDVDVPGFLERLRASNPDQVSVGKVNEHLPTDLTNAKSWTMKEFLAFEPSSLQVRKLILPLNFERVKPFCETWVCHVMCGPVKVSAITRGKFASLQLGFRYLPDDLRLEHSIGYICCMCKHLFMCTLHSDSML